MRKGLSVFLAVVLCVLLCACGVDKKYNAILEYFDSGNYEGIKSEMMVLSPEFKAEYEQLLEKAGQYDKYQTLIALLESENYEAAAADLAGRIPEPPKPASTEVAITMDNWSEYFEILEIPVADPFGKLYMYCFVFAPRAEYVNRIDYETDFSLDISHADTYMGEYKYSFDPETGEFAYLDAKYKFTDTIYNVRSMSNTTLKCYVNNDCQVTYDDFSAVLYSGAVFDDIVQKYTVEIDNIRGSIYVLD